jgi:hypothetical protein
MNEKVQLRAYANLALILINKAESHNYSTTLVEVKNFNMSGIHTTLQTDKRDLNIMHSLNFKRNH